MTHLQCPGHNKNRWTDFERSSEMLIVVSKMPHLPHFGIIRILLKNGLRHFYVFIEAPPQAKKSRKSNGQIRRKLCYRLTYGRSKFNLLKSSAINYLHYDEMTISIHFSRHRFRVLITLNTLWTEMFPLPEWFEKMSINRFWKDATNNKSFW